MLDAIERVSQTAISTLQTSAGKGFTVDCIEEFKTLEVIYRLIRESYFDYIDGKVWAVLSNQDLLNITNVIRPTNELLLL